MIETGKELATACKKVAENYKTLYVMGCFGAPLTGANVSRYCNNHSYNKQATRQKMIKAVANQTPPYYGFDCVNLIKGLLWGWNGTASKTYGGAGYAVNGVPDINADVMFDRCKEKSTDFSRIEVGEAVWMSGHIGVYIGDGLAVECSPKWKNCVQITSCNCSVTGYHRRNWTKHGKLPYVTYSESEEEAPKKTVDEIAREVIAGEWYNGEDRRQLLIDAGYDYAAVQKRVNEILKGETTTPPKKSLNEIACEVIRGEWGNGEKRKKLLQEAGYNYEAVQQCVNDLLISK